MTFYVFDLDGTLADLSHRRHLLPDWDAFFAACGGDEPILPVIELLLRLWNGRPSVKIEIWSGRSDAVRGLTEDWLARQGISGSLLTCMRTAGDHRPDDEVKREFLHGTDWPDIVFDDRDRVVAMWRSLGVTCLQVAPGDF